MKINIRYIAILFITTLATTTSQAQEFTLMQSVGTAQEILLNPALKPYDATFMSIPAIGSFEIGLDNSFKYNSVFTHRNGKNYLDTDLLLKKSAGSNMLLTRADVDILNIGFRLGDSKRHFMGVSLRGRVHFGTSYPGDIFAMALNNTIDSKSIYDLSISNNVTGWAELGVSYTFSPNSNWNIGVRAKYLNGIMSIKGDDVQITAKKQLDKYMISANAFTVYGGNADFGGSNGSMFKNSGKHMLSNPGFGFDIGGSYVSDDHKWRASASVSDIGFIFWNKKHSSKMVVKNPGKEFEFLGAADLGNFISGGAKLDKVLDSTYKALTKTIGMDTISGIGFTSSLPTTFRFGTEYAIDDQLRHNITLNASGTLPYKGRLHYGISAGYAYRTINDKWQLMTSYTYKWNDPVNIGFGVVFTSGCVQVLLMTDDVIGAVSPVSSESLGVRFGFNFFMGKNRKSKTGA